MSGSPSNGAAAPPKFHDSTGQYECGKRSSLTRKLALICSAALVIIVPFNWIMNVMKHANIVTLHFFNSAQLNGLRTFLRSFQCICFSVATAELLGADEAGEPGDRLDVRVVGLELSIARHDEFEDERGYVGTADIVVRLCQNFLREAPQSKHFYEVVAGKERCEQEPEAERESLSNGQT